MRVNVYVCVCVRVRACVRVQKKVIAEVSYLSEEGHSEVRAQHPLPRMHHLHHLGVGAVQGVVQVGQFLQTHRHTRHRVTCLYLEL